MKNEKSAAISRRFCLTVSILLFFISANAQAELLNLTMQSSPDIFSGFIDITYNANINAFSATGYNFTITTDGINQIDFDEYNPGDFSLSANIDETGEALAGSLEILGSVAGYGGAHPLLVCDIVDFGYGFWDTLNPDSDAALFEFTFEVLGGDLSEMYGGRGALVGVIIGCVSVDASVSETQFTTGFSNLFGNGPGYGTAVADTGMPIPEPISIMLLGLGAAMIRKK